MHVAVFWRWLLMTQRRSTAMLRRRLMRISSQRTIAPTAGHHERLIGAGASASEMRRPPRRARSRPETAALSFVRPRRDD